MRERERERDRQRETERETELGDLFIVFFRWYAPLVADSFLLCYERDFMLSLSDNNPSCPTKGCDCLI